MSEQRVRPDVSSLLQAIRGQVAQLESDVRLSEASPIQRISDNVAPLPGSPRAQPDTSSLLRVLRERADQLSSDVRFYDIGIVQQIGNGVATLSGLPRARTDELVTFPTGACPGRAPTNWSPSPPACGA